MSKFRSNRSKDSSRPLAVSFVALFGWVCFVKEFQMKYLLLILVVLLVGCINPYGNDATPKEYTVWYNIEGEGLVEEAYYYNPETDTTEELGLTQYHSGIMIASEGQTLWLHVVNSFGAFHLEIWVDDERVIVSEGFTGECYVEWVLQ